MTSKPDEPQASKPQSNPIAVWGIVIGVAGVGIAVAAYVFPEAFGEKPSSPEARAPYLTEVDGMCGRTIQEMRAILDDGVEPADYAAMGRALDGLLQRWVALPLPDEQDRELVAPALDALESAALAVNDEALSIQNQDLEGAKEDGARVGSALDDFRVSSRSYGLTVCPGIGR